MLFPAGPEALAAFEAELAAEAERRRWTEADEKAYWAEIKRINDEKAAAAAAEKKRRKAMTKEERAADDARIKKEQEAEKAANEEVVLREEKVIKRGNGIDQASIVKVGFWFVQRVVIVCFQHIVVGCVG
jgi:hypothetical protein